MFAVFHTGNIVSSDQFLFSRCKLCLRYTAGNLNENPSMRAIAKVLRARASEHSSNFCEQFEQRPIFASTFELDRTIRHPFTGTRNYQSHEFEWLKSILTAVNGQLQKSSILLKCFRKCSETFILPSAIICTIICTIHKQRDHSSKTTAKS